MKEIEKLRGEIDRMDTEILNLINQRARIAIEIGKIKKEEKAEIHAPHREMEIYERLKKENKGPFPNSALQAVFREIISASLALERPLRVAYLGPKATFTHLACMKQFGISAAYVPVTSIKEVKARQSPVFAFAEEGDEAIEGLADRTIFVPAVDPLLSPVVHSVALQLLAYYTAKERGCPIDFPRNLAKSVTVE